MTFRNPILGGGGSVLLRPAIQSPNYVPGQSGWAIKRDGTAELTAVTIRNGETVGSTDLYYNGTPAAGNLIASIAESSGTDQYGNPYLAGICTYTYDQAYTQISDGVVYVGPMLQASPQTNWAAVMQYNTGGALQLAGSILRGLPLTSHHPAVVTLQAGATGVSTPSGTEPYVAFTDTASTSQSVVSAHISGALLKTDAAGNVQQWQDPTSLLGTGWAIGPSAGTVQPLQYRLDGMDNLILDGVVHSTSTTPASTIFTLPAGYRPKLTRRSPGVSNSGGTATVRFCEVNASGAVSINQNLTTASTDVYFECSIPLGNIK